jgi:hypothetical protein
VSADGPRTSNYRFAAVLALALSCSDAPKPPPQAAELEGTLIARVGQEEIAAETVLAVAAAQGIDTSRALDLATFDALTAVEARARGLEAAHRRELNAVAARALIGELAREARQEGPPSQADLDQLDRDYAFWLKVERPALVVTVHVVVELAPDADAKAVESGLALARKYGEAVAPSAALARLEPGPDHEATLAAIPDQDPAAEDFMRRAQAIDRGDAKVTIQQLPPVGDDNLTVEPPGRGPFLPEFVSGAFKLSERGDLSEPVRTPAGFHVIMLLARIPPPNLSAEVRQRLFEEKIVEIRTGRRIAELLTALRADTEISEERSVDSILEQVRVAP